MACRAQDFEQCFFLYPGLDVKTAACGGLGVFTKDAVAALQVLVLERHIFAATPLQSFQSVRPRLCPRAGDLASWLKHVEGWSEDLSDSITNLLKIQFNSYADGLFDFGSKFNHSCAPNAGRLTWTDGLSAIIALHDIQEGEEVTVSYIHTSRWRLRRRLELVTSHCFWCECLRCATDGPEGEAPPRPADSDQALLPSEAAYWHLCDRDYGPNSPLAFSQALARSRMAFESGSEAGGQRLAREALEVLRKSGRSTRALEDILLKFPAGGGESWDFKDAVEPVISLLSALTAFAFTFFFASVLLLCLGVALSTGFMQYEDLDIRTWAWLGGMGMAMILLRVVIAVLTFTSFEEHLEKRGQL